MAVLPVHYRRSTAEDVEDQKRGYCKLERGPAVPGRYCQRYSQQSKDRGGTTGRSGGTTAGQENLKTAETKTVIT